MSGVEELRLAADNGETLIAWFRGPGFELPRIGLKAGPLSQWLDAALKEAGLNKKSQPNR